MFWYVFGFKFFSSDLKSLPLLINFWLHSSEVVNELLYRLQVYGISWMVIFVILFVMKVSIILLKFLILFFPSGTSIK